MPNSWILGSGMKTPLDLGRRVVYPLGSRAAGRLTPWISGGESSTPLDLGRWAKDPPRSWATG